MDFKGTGFNLVTHKASSSYTHEEVASFFLFSWFIQWQNSTWPKRRNLELLKNVLQMHQQLRMPKKIWFVFCVCVCMCLVLILFFLFAFHFLVFLCLFCFFKLPESVSLKLAYHPFRCISRLHQRYLYLLVTFKCKRRKLDSSRC